MKELLLLTIIAGLIFVSFLFFLVIAILTKNRIKLFISIALLFLTFCIGFWISYLFVTKSYLKVNSALKPRSGIEIYIALFGKPAKNCVAVINKMDQIVPRLDCCIWLEFATCPVELRRIVSQEQYKMTKYLSLDTTGYLPNYGPPDLNGGYHMFLAIVLLYCKRIILMIQTMIRS